jgi:hypothetical protein
MPDPTPEPGPSPEFYQSIDAGFYHSFGIAPNDVLLLSHLGFRKDGTLWAGEIMSLAS